MYKSLISICVFFFSTSMYPSFNFFLLEGTTGAGKSTLLRLLANKINNLEVVDEQIERILDVEGTGNLLELFYKDHERWAYLFQTYVFMIRDEAVKQVVKLHPKKTILGDRSIYSTFYVFGKMLYEKNIFHEIEWNIYQQWFTYNIQRSMIKPKGFIYLRTTPNICYERVKRRNRTEEQGAQFDYYKSEFDFHEKWLINKEVDYVWLRNIPVLVLDGDLDFLHNEEILNDIIEKIKVFIEDLSLKH